MPALNKRGHSIGPEDSGKLWVVWATGPHQWWFVYEMCSTKAAALETVDKLLKDDSHYDGVEIRGYTQSSKPVVCKGRSKP
jgi:hypothetical protein